MEVLGGRGGAMVRVVACVGTWGASAVSGTSTVAVCGENVGGRVRSGMRDGGAQEV